MEKHRRFSVHVLVPRRSRNIRISARLSEILSTHTFLYCLYGLSEVPYHSCFIGVFASLARLGHFECKMRRGKDDDVAGLFF
jgi:hypothetical protein